MSELPDESTLAEQILQVLKKSRKGFSTNPQIRSELKVPESEFERYWQAHRSLIEKGLIEPARARGGGVRLVPDPPVVGPATAAEIADPETIREQHYYAPIRHALESGFIGAKGLDRSEVVLEVCANKRRKGEGAWSVPDLALTACQTLQFIPGKILSIFSFEVKTTDNVNLQSVYEALAHTRFVNFSYLLVVGNGTQEWVEDAATKHVIEECSRHGVGLIVGDGKDSWNEYEIYIEGERFSPDFNRQDQFIARLFQSEGQEKIRRAIR